MDVGSDGNFTANAIKIPFQFNPQITGSVFSVNKTLTLRKIVV
jgi:hypothetical protein